MREEPPARPVFEVPPERPWAWEAKFKREDLERLRNFQVFPDVIIGEIYSAEFVDSSTIKMERILTVEATTVDRVVEGPAEPRC